MGETHTKAWSVTLQACLSCRHVCMFQTASEPDQKPDSVLASYSRTPQTEFYWCGNSASGCCWAIKLRSLETRGMFLGGVRSFGCQLGCVDDRIKGLFFPTRFAAVCAFDIQDVKFGFPKRKRSCWCFQKWLIFPKVPLEGSSSQQEACLGFLPLWF